MTKWSQMSPRERDALVAEKVLGLETKQVSESTWWERHVEWSNTWSPLKGYSTEISAAWDVVDAMNKRWYVGIERQGSNDEALWICNIAGYCGGKTAPEAICRSALFAVGVDVE